MIAAGSSGNPLARRHRSQRRGEERAQSGAASHLQHIAADALVVVNDVCLEGLLELDPLEPRSLQLARSAVMGSSLAALIAG